MYCLSTKLHCMLTAVCSGGSRIFPRGGGWRQLPKWVANLFFRPKTAWKWKNSDPRGTRVPGAPLGRPWCVNKIGRVDNKDDRKNACGSGTHLLSGQLISTVFTNWFLVVSNFPACVNFTILRAHMAMTFTTRGWKVFDSAQPKIFNT